MGLTKTQMHREDVGDELNPVNHEGRKQKGCDRKRTHADEKNIDGSGYALAPAAMTAVGEMLVVVRAHGRGEARYVVTPSREDVPNDLINAGGLMGPAIR